MENCFYLFSVWGGVLSGTLPLPFFQSLLLPVYVVKLGFLLFSNFKSNNDKHKNFRRKFHKFYFVYSVSWEYVHSGVSQVLYFVYSVSWEYVVCAFRGFTKKYEAVKITESSLDIPETPTKYLRPQLNEKLSKM